MSPRRKEGMGLGSEMGLTMIEVVVATLVLVLGSLATFNILRAATINAQRAKGTQVALDRAQQEMEALRSLSNSELALTSTPPHSPDSLNPDYRVNETKETFALTRDPSEEASPPRLVVEGGPIYGGGFISGAVVVPEEKFTSGDVTGTVYRYVVWRNDESCGASCPGEQDFKQIIVAVKLDQKSNEAAERGYVEVQSDFVDPSDSAANDPIPPVGGSVNSPQQFFLSDTPCSGTGSTEREEWPQREVTGNHYLHNTLGTCADGRKEGSEEGAPDALLLGSPPDPAPSDPSNPLVYDYSKDYSGQITPETAKGVQIVPDDSGGCHYEPTGATVPQWQVHRWVTDPMPFDFTMTKSATVDFFTRSLSDLPYTGTLCIYLFDRHEGGGGPEDTLLLNTEAEGEAAYWTYSGESNGQWPRNSWTEVRVPMTFAETTILANDRLGLAFSVDGGSESGAVPVLYDHPDYRARIEIETPTPLNAG